MKHLVILLFFIPNLTFSQFHTKVNFEKKLSWEQVKEKAKREHKNIFIDGYTTWCVWCRWLDNRIFTDSIVGECLNKNFVSVKIQFDSSKKDDQFIQSWYADAHRMIIDYNIQSYPTQLFFDSEGEILHKVVGVESKSGVQGYTEMINRSLNPNLQYYRLKRELAKEPQNAILHKNLSMAAFYAGEYKESEIALYQYLSLTNCKDWTIEKIEFAVSMLHSQKDTLFQILNTNKNVFDSITIDPISSDAIRTTIYYDDIERVIFRGKGQVEDYRYYLKEPDWTSLQAILNTKFTKMLATEVIEFGKIAFYKDQNNWNKYFATVTTFIQNYSEHIASKTYLDFANEILIHTSEKSRIKEGIDIINKSLQLHYTKNGETIKDKLIKKYAST